MKIIIIDYGAGNVQSIFNAIKEIDDKSDIIISNKVADLKSANYFILPGVGAFGDCMEGLKSVDGFLSELRNQILIYKKTIICHLMFSIQRMKA
jgi:glutamine amidotransferase